MSGFDWIIAAIFLISILVGILRGFVKEILSLTSWILAFWLGNRFCHEAGEFLSGFINIPAEAFRIGAGFARCGKADAAFAVIDDLEIDDLAAPIRLEIITALMATRQEREAAGIRN